jgi:cell division septum initiation protein DivIVA
MLENARENAAEMVENAGKEAGDVIKNANAQAAKILTEAEAEYERKVSENEITLEAERRAQLLEKKAEVNANIVYDGAKQYADEVLADVQKFLNSYQNSVMSNRRELGVLQRLQPAEAQAPVISQQSHVRPVQPGRQAVSVRPAQAGPMREEEELEEPVAEKKPKQPWWKLRFKGDYEEDLEEDIDEEEEEVREAETKAPGGQKQKSRWNRELDVDLDEK